MDLRRLKYEDYDRINELWERCHKGKYGIPARKFIITEAVVENGKLAGYGLVRFFAEAMLYLDTDASEYERAKAFLMLMEQAIIDAKGIGIDQLNVGVEDEEFMSLLQRKFGFVRRDPVLYLGLEDSNGK